ncbi:MAG: DUF883 family protein [Rhodomicrobium sp.]|nr:DUF883 family protein [Rhodomicrobium sp.]
MNEPTYLNTDAAKNSSSQNQEDLKVQIEKLKSDIADLTDTVKREARDKLKDAEAVATEKFEDLEAQIRRKPITAAMISAGIGFLLGAILSR